jgi:proline racemase/trans-L-3-hydroxyproline dehydratase
MGEKRELLQQRYDGIRCSLMHEPRGHRDMFGSILMDPTDSQADLGIVFMDGGGYLNMCVHGTIGAVTVALDIGILETKAPITTVLLDTPAGPVRVSAEIKDEAVSQVTVENVPSFLFREGVLINVPGLGGVRMDIAYGGNFFALVDASAVSLAVVPEQIDELVDVGMRILQRANEEIPVQHPTLSHIRSIDLVELHDTIGGPEAKRKRNIVVFGRGQFDRSPCGTGTCARMAALFAKGQLALEEPFLHESIIGTTFTGRLLRTAKVGEFPAVIPAITGQAFVTGIQQIVIDQADPLKEGFQI